MWGVLLICKDKLLSERNVVHDFLFGLNALDSVPRYSRRAPSCKHLRIDIEILLLLH